MVAPIVTVQGFYTKSAYDAVNSMMAQSPTFNAAMQAAGARYTDIVITIGNGFSNVPTQVPGTTSSGRLLQRS
jgi:hypothetical protein